MTCIYGVAVLCIHSNTIFIYVYLTIHWAWRRSRGIERNGWAEWLASSDKSKALDNESCQQQCRYCVAASEELHFLVLKNAGWRIIDSRKKMYAPAYNDLSAIYANTNRIYQ